MRERERKKVQDRKESNYEDRIGIGCKKRGKDGI